MLIIEKNTTFIKNQIFKLLCPYPTESTGFNKCDIYC